MKLEDFIDSVMGLNTQVNSVINKYKYQKVKDAEEGLRRDLKGATIIFYDIDGNSTSGLSEIEKDHWKEKKIISGYIVQEHHDLIYHSDFKNIYIDIYVE